SPRPEGDGHMDDVAAIRRWFAEDLRLRTPVTRNLAVIEAFATVPRERLLAGPGPWQLISFNRLDLPFTTPDVAPHWLYHDVLVAFAGSTHPAPLWLDRLAEGGRLMMPLTGEDRLGFMLRAIRRSETFAAASIGSVGIYPCMGGRDDQAAARLSQTVASSAR